MNGESLGRTIRKHKLGERLSNDELRNAAIDLPQVVAFLTAMGGEDSLVRCLSSVQVEFISYHHARKQV